MPSYNPDVPTVTIDIPNAARYDVIVERNALATVGPRLAESFKTKRVSVITDASVGKHWLRSLTDSLTSAGITSVVATFAGGEEHKTLHSVAALFDQLLPGKLDRKTPVIAIGGGIVGDVGGFVAGTLLRGVPLVQIPTTLLAMVDASVGGKTGVNHAVGKNLIGIFHQPSLVIADPQTLVTLPKSELTGGLAECIKHELIRDAAGFDKLEKNIHRALALDLDYLVGLIAHNVAIKARIVEADPFERGVRAHLNLGHTFAHAIEKVSSHSISHGAAVSLGTGAATMLSTRMNILDRPSADRILSLLQSTGLPTRCANLDADAIVDAMYFDKKVEGGKLRLILLEKVGSAIIRDDVPIEAIRYAIRGIVD